MNIGELMADLINNADKVKTVSDIEPYMYTMKSVYFGKFEPEWLFEHKLRYPERNEIQHRLDFEAQFPEMTADEVDKYIETVDRFLRK